MFTLRLVFAGLIAFVPVDRQGNVDDLAMPPEPRRVWALLVATDGLNTDARGRTLHSHQAVLRSRLQLPDPSRRCRDRWCIDLQDESLSLSFGDGSNPERIGLVRNTRMAGRPLPCCTDVDDPVCGNAAADRRCDGRTPGATEQMKDFFWLISFQELVPGAKLHAGSWQWSDNTDRIAARLRLDHGVLRTLYLQQEEGVRDPGNLSDSFKHAAVIRFDGSSAWQPRGVAKTVVLTVPNLNGSVTFHSQSLSGGSDREWKIHRPADCGEPCVVEIEVLNWPTDDVYPPQSRRNEEPTSHRHFELMWRLVEDPPASLPSPIDKERRDVDLLCPEVRP